MFKNLTIKTRLVFVLAFLGLQLVVGAVIGIFSLSLSNGAMQSMYHGRIAPMVELNSVIRLLNENQLNLAMALTSPDAQVVERLMTNVEDNIGKISQHWDAYMANDMSAAEKAGALQFAEHRKKLVVEGVLPVVKALRTGDISTADAAMHGATTKLFAPVRQSIDDLIRLEVELSRKDYESAAATFQTVRAVCIAGVVFGLVLAAIIGILLVRAIVRPLERAVAFAEAVADGDLTQRIEAGSRDETGRMMDAMKGMNGALVRIVGEVRSGAESIASASGQIAAGNLDLSARTEQQACSLEETASSMEELTSTVKQNADNARQANGLAQSASEAAVKGGAVVGEVVDTMESINASSRKIVDIIAVIDSIAFQTNILALNAAVEAARAGEQGRGFAVVASEVRNLAQRSANAAREIKQLIGDSVEKVEAGSRLVGDAGATMREIVERVRRVTDIMAEIASASEEQTTGIEQINQAIAQMEDVTQQNASLVEEAAAASRALEGQTRTLAALVSVFKLDDAHEASAAVARTAGAAARPRVAAPGAAARIAGGAGVAPALMQAESATSEASEASEA
jgi:methyl-accepting chemotaxis protein-1 (serine sensor receptor)